MTMTMTELAKLAGVSQCTVSLVLNQSKGRRISPDTEARVLEIAKAHNFRINRTAAELRKRTSTIIGIVIVTPHLPSYAEKVSFLQEAVLRHGYRPIFSFYSSLDELENAIRNILEYPLAGIISWDYHPLFDTANIPTVIYETAHPRYDAVLIDGATYAQNTVELAKRFGHSSIAYLGAQNNNRAAMLKKYSEENGLHTEFVKYDLGNDSYDTVSEELLRRPKESRPTLLVCNDFYTNAVYRAAQKVGVRIPEDVSVLSNYTRDVEFLYPRVTTWTMKVEETCESLVEVLLQRIKEPTRSIEHRKIPTEINSGDSIVARICSLN